MIRQLLTESLLLALIGGALGTLIAVWGTAALSRLATLYLPRAREIGIDGGVLAFTAALSLVTGIVFGLLPAINGSRADVQSVLNEGGRGASAGVARARLRAGLVVTEIAVALVLVAGAGLLLRSFQRLVAVEPGFDPSHRLALQVWLPVPNEPEKGRFFTLQQRYAFYQRIQESVGQVPGVEQAALVNRLPLNGRSSGRFYIEGRPPLAADEQPPIAEYRGVSPNYFRAMGIPVLKGDGFPAVADSNSRGTLVINQVLADRYFPNENPVGRRLKVFGSQSPFMEITGVVGATRQVSLEAAPTAELYLDIRRNAGNEMAMVIQTAGPPLNQRAAVLKAIHDVDAEQPVFGVRSMEQLLAEAGAPRRFSLLLLGLFASMALLLSAIGIYGVMAYTTTQRRHEIGIRMALGALPRDVFGLVVGQGMRLVALGLGIGLVGAWALSRVLTGQLFEIRPGDPMTYVVAAALLGAVALAANYLPALRAAKVDPLIAMRSD
jgi:putative ABC transport system permease protein